jgi:nucleoside-diphosphate kinase
MGEEYEKLVQQSLVVFKPDAVQRGIVGELLTRFERVGLKIIATKMVNPDRNHYYKHYEDIGKMITRRGEDAFNQNLAYMSSGPVIAVIFEGVEAVPVIRKIVGATEPKAADMGTIRGDYSHISFGYANSKKIGISNLIHASGSPEEAEEEIKHWFKKSEIQDYQTLNERYTR